MFPCEWFCYLAVDRHMGSRVTPSAEHLLRQDHFRSGLQRHTATPGSGGLPVLSTAGAVCTAVKRYCKQNTASATQGTVLSPPAPKHLHFVTCSASAN